jgi:serine/threonine-protein kinase
LTAQEGSLVGQTLGVYRLRSLLGVGGMAEVYLAEDPTLRRDIAVKVLPRSLATDPGYVERFRNEAQRVANLSHPHITPVYAFGEDRGLLYLVMPRLKESLREHMERGHGMVPLQEAVRLTNQIAAALYIAHEHGIVHRDVKPENILLDESGKAMLTDFGIAREMSSLREAGVARTLAATGLPVGTPEYMAPEQLRGMPATEQVDLYALGVVLYEMLTGHVPHDATTPYEVATAVLRDEPKLPTYYNPSIPPEVENVILTAMKKDPVERYRTMKDFAMALRGAINGQSQPVNSGALRWTQFSPPNRPDANNPAASQTRAPKGVAAAAAASSLILPPQIPMDETSRRPTVQNNDALAQRFAVDSAARDKREVNRKSRYLLMGVGVVMLLALTGAGLTVTHMGGLFSNAVDSPPLTSKAKPTTTPKATAIPTPTLTATPAPTQTPYYIVITPPPPPPPPPQLSISPTTIVFMPVGGGYYCQPSNSVVITNYDSTNLTWNWTWSSSSPSLPPKTTLNWSLNGGGMQPMQPTQPTSMPQDSQGIQAYNGTNAHSDMLKLLATNCNSFKINAPYTVTMTDSKGRTYTLTLTYGG